MGATLDLVTELIRLDSDGTGPPLEPTYTAGPSDPLGDRLICFTAAGATSFELLRFRPEWGDAPGFEPAIRASVEAIGRLDPSLATVRAVERIDELNGLTLVSKRQSGRRLSELMPRARSTPYAVELVREIGPALALLHAAGHAHGALTPERVIVSREGRLVVLEHVLGAALGTLALPADRLRALTGIAVADGTGASRIRPSLDVVQLGFIALSLIAGERLGPLDYPGRMVAVLDEFSRVDPPGAAKLRPWLERALQIGGRPFADASEALDAFRGTNVAASTRAVAFPAAPPDRPAPATTAPAPVLRPQPAPASRPLPVPAAPAPRPLPMAVTTEPDEPPVWFQNATHLRRVASALAAIVIVQSAILAYLFLRDSSGAIPVARAAAAVVENRAVPPNPTARSRTRPVTDVSEGALVTEPADLTALFPELAVESAAVELGTVMVVSPIDLRVFEGDTELGSTADPITIPAGAHTLDVVNEELGFRSQQAVTVFGGGTTSVTIAVPDGLVDLEARPSAEVWINGAAIGQTPIVGLSLPIGRHDITFRHPELGERRETAVVKVDGVARVTVIFQ